MFRKLFAPKPSAAKAQVFGDVSVMRRGRRWQGGYSLQNGKLLVSSAWGSRSESINRSMGDVDERAKTLLAKIVDAAPELEPEMDPMQPDPPLTSPEPPAEIDDPAAIPEIPADA
jgi:hypothetical protein